MKKWYLVCSVDAVNIDFATVIESPSEPDFWTCQDIASAHNCEFWSLSELGTLKEGSVNE